MNIANLKGLLVYLFSFGLGRGALFVAPLLLANFLYGAEYGVLETALAAASVWAGVVSFGTGGVIPLVLLRNNRQATIRGIVVHHLLVVGVAGCFFLAAVALQWPHVWKLTAVLTACLVMQGLASTHLKTLGHSDASVLIDAGLLSLMAVATIGAHYMSAVQPVNFIMGAALLYCLVLVVAYLRILAPHGSEQGSLAWGATLKVGIPLMLGGLLSLLATTSGRLGMGLLASPQLTAEYAVLARAGALPVVAHQLILIARFRDLFAQSDQAAKRAILQIVMLVAGSVLGFFVLSPWLGFVLGPAFVHAFGQHKMAGFLIVAQAVLWSAIALNDLVIARHQVMHRVLPYSIGFLAFALGAGGLALAWSGVSLEGFVMVHSGVMLSFYLAQSWIMNFLGLRIFRVWLTTTALFVALTAVGLLSSFVY